MVDEGDKFLHRIETDHLRGIGHEFGQGVDVGVVYAPIVGTDQIKYSAPPRSSAEAEMTRMTVYMTSCARLFG